MIDSIIVNDLEDNVVDLMKEYKGKALLIIIYNNACLGCTGRAIPLAYEFQQENKDLQVIGIHSNLGRLNPSPEEIKSIFTSGEVPFPIYMDKTHKVYDQFSAEGTPQWLAITSNGELYRSLYGSQEGAQSRLNYIVDALLNDTE